MALINEHFLKLQNNYLFSDIAKKVNSFKVTHPKKKIIRMGIGDVTQPLAPAVIEAMHKAVDEMASKDTFHGYGPEQGYPFLIDAIIKNDYASRGIFLEPGEVFVSDGAKSDCGNIGDMLRHDNSIGVTDPVYPVYIDSKTAGLTGVRCGYTIVPKELNAFTLAGERVPLNRMWNRRQCTKFNGTSYITQRGAEAVYSPEGKEQVRKTIDYYMANARIMRESLQSCGLRVYGGENAPYIWLKTPDGLSSWKFFDKLLYEVNIVGTPGVGFGPGGEGFLRLTAFGDRDDTLEAMSRLKKWLL